MKLENLSYMNMTDTINCNFSIGDSIMITENEIASELLTSFDTQRHDTQIELNDHYINYIDDSLVNSESKTIEKNEQKMSESKTQENLVQLEVSELPIEIFIDENIRCKFECIFHEYDSQVIISYSNIFQRAYVTFSDPKIAFEVRMNMNGKEFHHKKISVSYSLQNSLSIKYLKPPKHEQIYMQSPPTTPPIGWVTKREEMPDINFDLFFALSKLHSNESLEILPKRNNLPAIIIHPCSDTSDDDNDINSIANEFSQNKYQLNEATQHTESLHHATREQQIKESTGDGDKLIS